jgi:hypothetical protein
MARIPVQGTHEDQQLHRHRQACESVDGVSEINNNHPFYTFQDIQMRFDITFQDLKQRQDG